MTHHNRRGRVNVRLLIVLGLVFSVAATSLVIVHTMRKRVAAQKAKEVGDQAFEQKNWEVAGREYRIYLGKFGDDMKVMKKFAEAEMEIRPLSANTVGSAILAYRKVLRNEPGDKDISDRLYRLYMMVGDYTNAGYVANQRLSVDPRDASAILWMGRAMLAQRQNADLEKKLNEFIEKDPSAVPVYALLAQSALVGGDPRGSERALDTLNKAVRNNPTSAEAYARLAQLLAIAGGGQQLDKAREYLEKADALEIKDADTRLLLADAWLELGNLDRARKELAIAQELPLAPQAIYDFEREQTKLSFFLTSGRLALLTADTAQALALAEQGVKELTQDRRLQFLSMATQLYVAAGKPEKAVDLLKEFHAAFDEPARGNKKLAEQLALLDALLSNAQTRPYEALEELQNIVNVQEVQDPMVYREIGYGFMRTNQDRRAVEALEKYTSLKRDDYHALVSLARIHYRNYDWPKTFKFSDLAFRLPQKENVDARVLSIDAILRGGKGVKPSDSEVEGFSEELKDLKQKYPRRIDIRLLEAQIAGLKSPDAAIGILRQASKECDLPVNATLQIADILKSQNKIDEAIQVCREAIQQAPDSAQPRIALAALQFDSGKRAESRKTLEEAAATLKDEESLVLQLTLAANLLGVGKADNVPADREKGLALLRKLASDNPKDIRPRLQLLDQKEVQDNITPGNNEPQTLVDQIKGIENDRGIRWKYEQARLLMRGAWKPQQEAIVNLLTKVVEGDPAWTSAVLLLGGVYEASNKDDKAQEVYRQFVTSNPDNTAVVSRYVQLLERQGRFMEASEILDRLPNAKDKDVASLKIGFAVAQNRLVEARKALEVQTGENPKDAGSRVLLARVMYRQDSKNAGEALKFLDQAQKLAPDLLSVVSTRVMILEAEKRREEALKVLNDEVQRRNDFQAYLLRAEYLASIGKLAEAEKDYQHLTTFPASVAEGNLRLGSFYERTKQSDKAIPAYEAGFKADPGKDSQSKRALTRALVVNDNPAARQRGQQLLAELLKDSGEEADVMMIQAQSLLAEGTMESRTKAVGILAKVVQLNPRNISAHLQLIQFASAEGDLAKAAQLVAQALGANPESAELLLVNAGIETDQENYVRARELVHAVLQRDPENLAASNLMVQLCIQLNELDKAQTQNDAVLQKEPDNESARLAQAKIAERQGKPADAIRLLEAFRQTPGGKKSIQAALSLADLYRQQKDYAKCDQMLQELDKSSPELFNAFVIRLQVLAEQQKFDEFFKLVDARLKARPKDSQTLNSVATILSTVQAPAELIRAKPIFEHFIAENPTDITARLSLAILAYRTLDMKGAAAVYRAALKIDPYNIRALNNMAWITSEEMQSTKEELESARELITTAILKFQKDPVLLNTRGVIFYRLNQMDKAKADLEDCLKMSNILPGTRARTLAFLGRIQTQIYPPNPTEARNLFEKALEIDNKNKVLTPKERASIEETLNGTPSRPASK